MRGTGPPPKSIYILNPLFYAWDWRLGGVEVEAAWCGVAKKADMVGCRFRGVY
jgi:hypothetical protein